MVSKMRMEDGCSLLSNMYSCREEVWPMIVNLSRSNHLRIPRHQSFPFLGDSLTTGFGVIKGVTQLIARELAITILDTFSGNTLVKRPLKAPEISHNKTTNFQRLECPAALEILKGN
jgi:hypothetical protein